MRKEVFENGEYYHIFNRGVDKRLIFGDQYDVQRFLQSMEEFNVVKPIGSIYENSFRKKDALGNPVSKLVDFVCYCVNPNHYHFVLKQVKDKGIEKFMHRLNLGYTKYFNQKYERNGVLLQGRYKAVYVLNNEYLLHLSVYVNLNNKVHQLGNSVSKLARSSWGEYIGRYKEDFCDKDIVLSQFKNLKEYENFAKNSLNYICEKKELEKILLE